MGRLSPADFLTGYGFRRPNVTPLEVSRQVCGLDYPFTIPRKLGSLGAARLVSTPSRLEYRPGLARDCHLRFPRIWAVLHRRFPRRALKFFLSPLRMPFRHARAQLS